MDISHLMGSLDQAADSVPPGTSQAVREIWDECRMMVRYVLGIMADIQAGTYNAETAAADFQYWVDDNGNGLPHSLEYYASNGGETVG